MKRSEILEAAKKCVCGKREALLTLCIEAIENGMRFESKPENTEEK